MSDPSKLKNKKSFNSLTDCFQKQASRLDTSVEVSFDVAEIIAKGWPFTGGDFVKQFLLLASEKLCPEVEDKF